MIINPGLPPVLISLTAITNPGKLLLLQRYSHQTMVNIEPLTINPGHGYSYVYSYGLLLTVTAILSILSHGQY